jgi:Tol biopolymer transport system component
MNIGPGTRLLHFEVSASIGKGGMGEVFRAKDTKLGRDVAIKVLPEEFTKDAERLARFEREARVLASLNHPHIASIYGFEEVEGNRFLVMELAEGEDLSAVLARGPLPIDEALAYAKQIATALDAAHEKGIVHRDLKPANVMVSGEGKIRVLDFGLAKALDTEERYEDFSNSPTMVRAATHAGMILGTAAYMSPEQARGKMVDKRADIWAFGVVLWEMLTGRRLFGGDTVSDTLASVLKEEPDWSELPRDLPPNVVRVLRRCLTKRPAERMRDVGDVLADLEDASAPAGEAAAAIREGSRVRAWLPWAIAAAALAALVVGLVTRSTPDVELPLRKLMVYQPSELSERNSKLSPDGRYLAYSDKEGVLIRMLDSTIARRVDAAEAEWAMTFWSPDSKWLAFAGEDKLWKVAVDDPTPTTICSIPPERRSICGAWGANDRIVLCQWRGGLLEVSANGGSLKEFLPATEDLVDYHHLSFLPDGTTLVGLPHLSSEIASLEVIEGTTRRTILELENESIRGVAGYSPTGHLVFGRETESGVWAVPFSLESLTTTGEPFVIAPGAAFPSVADDGSLAYVSNIDLNPSQLVRVSFDGQIAGTIGDPGEGLWGPLPSPDGTRLAFTAEEKGNDVLMLLDLATGSRRPLTIPSPGYEDEASSWSPDGKQLLITRRVPGNWGSPDNGLWLIDVDGTGGPRPVAPLGVSGRFLPDGRTIVYQEFSIRNEDNILLKSLDGAEDPRPLIVSPASSRDPAVSPDGRLMAYTSDESGSAEVWITTLPGAESRRQISNGGGYGPLWGRDGTLYYSGQWTEGGGVYAVKVTGNESPSVGVPKLLFEREERKLRDYRLMPDDSAFVMVQDLEPKDRGLIYVQNWFAEFDRK